MEKNTIGESVTNTLFDGHPVAAIYSEFQKKNRGNKNMKTETIAPDIPELPPETIDFAREVGKLAEKYHLQQVDMKVRIDTGYGSAYWHSGRNVQQNVLVTVSRKDGRGRPRTQIYVTAEMNVTVDVINEPDS